MKKPQTIYLLSIKCYQYKINQYKPFVILKKVEFINMNRKGRYINNLLRYCIIVSKLLDRNVC